MMDESMVKIMQSLGLNFKPAEQSIKSFEGRVASLNRQLFDMKANALQGARDINHAFSSQLGSLGGSKVLVDQWGQPLKTIQTEAAKTSKDITEGFVSASTAAKAHSKSVQDVSKQYNAFASEWQRRMSWFMTGTMFYGTIKAAKELVTTASEVEMGMVEIARVMDDSTFIFEKYRTSLLDLGVEFGQTFDNVQHIALRWAQSGYNVADSLELTRTSLLALNTAELDAKYATEGLIGTMSQWGITAKDTLPVIDKINKTADDYAVTSQDLVDGLLRSSGAAKIMGMTLEDTIATLTVMREATGRTGQEVGNALNSILSYMQRATSLNAFESLGIKVFADDAKSELIPVMQIFPQLAAKWNTASDEIKDSFVAAAQEAGLMSEELATATVGMDGYMEGLSDVERRDAAQAAAGVYRRNYFIALIERFSRTQEVLNNMVDAEGYSMQENARTMEALQMKYQSLKTAVQELAVALGGAGLLDTLKGIVDVGTGAAQALAKMDEDSRAFLLTALELTGAVLSLNAAIRLFSDTSVIALAKVHPQVAAIGALAAMIGLLIINLKAANAQSLDDIMAKQEEIAKTEELIKKYDELKGKVDDNEEAKNSLLDVQRQLAAIYPDYVDSLDDEGNKLVTNVGLLREVIALKREELELKRQDAVSGARADLTGLLQKQRELQSKIDENKGRLESGDTTVSKVFDIHKVTWDERADIIREQQKLLQQKLEVDQNIKKTMALLDVDESKKWDAHRMKMQGIAPGGGTVSVGGATDILASTGIGSAGYTNEALRNALRMLDHKKRMDEISIADEIAYLEDVKALHVNNADELMDIDEKIYDAKKRLANESTQVLIESYNMEEGSIKHLAKLGVYGIKEQIEKYKELYAVKAKDLDEERVRIENMFSLHKTLLSEQLKDLEAIHKTNIENLEEEARKQKAVKEDRIRDIEAELDLLNKREDAYSHDKKIADLKEELAYWQVRTSEQARQKVADIEKQIDEEEHRRKTELKKQKLEDKKKSLQDEIKAIDDAAKAERDKMDKSFRLIKGAMDDHSIDMISLASTMAEGMYDAFEEGYLDKIRGALESRDYRTARQTAGDIPEFAGGAYDKTYNSPNAQIYRLASQILDYKRQYEVGGDTGAEQRAMSVYDKLEGLSKGLANELHQSNYITAKDIVDGLPKSHKGSRVLSYGAAYLAPGELIFPKDLSVRLENLIQALYARPAQSSGSYSDNRRETKIDTLLNVEQMYMGDEIDGEILSRDLRRTISSM